MATPYVTDESGKVGAGGKPILNRIQIQFIYIFAFLAQICIFHQQHISIVILHHAFDFSVLLY